MSTILALDQSSRISGFAVFKENKLFEFGQINLSEYNIGERLVFLRKWVQDLIVKYGVEEVYLEDIQLQNNVMNNVQTFKTLAQVIGVITEVLEEMGIKYTLILSTVWKSTLGIKGKNRPEQKRNAQIYVQTTFGIKPTQDECDAICIGQHAITKAGFNWSV